MSTISSSDSHSTRRFQIESKRSHLLRALLIGVLAGLLAVAVRRSVFEAEELRQNLLNFLHDRASTNRWIARLGWIILPMLALIVVALVGWVVDRFVPEAAGSGIPHLKGVLLHLRTLRWKLLLPVKFIGGVLSTGAGLSLGREGPTVQMGAAIAQGFADVFKLPSRSVPQLLTCGAGAGLAAAFNAPLAGFLFVIEELHRELSARTFAGALVAALSADIVARALSGESPSFSVSGYPALPLSFLPLAVVIGLMGGAFGSLFNSAIIKSCNLITSKKRSKLAAALAALSCGLVAWWLPSAVGGGHFAADHLLSGHIRWSVQFLLLLLLTKFVLTIISYASGMPGGVFAPILLMGALIGQAIGQSSAAIFPTMQTHTTALAILGMASFFSGSIRAPLTGIVLIVEMTGNYQQLLALAVTCITAELFADLLRAEPLYESLLKTDLRLRPVQCALDDPISEPRTLYIGIQMHSLLDRVALRQANLPTDCLVVGVERAGRELLPDADLVLHAGDHITVLIPEDQAEKSLLIVEMATGL